ncbi:helix-turn-helix domain-containing protein [Spirosoma sp. RP8]|uniref:Helix-turn-helix domain-containing protein n=1 Tax=Spirosoma liriopis TaxID=2937440 RepID=A0ABT0HIE2_9BACT|nr:helix-turn-helix transcriptional regulator [Spirosoma liriopis]MCK8491770.1 helix-turn-helix domain-containing protein [Spirosoma liriopis]
MQDTLGGELKALREARALTLKEAAEKLDMDFSMLARIEKGQRTVSEAMFSRFADLFSIEEKRLRTLALVDKVYRDVRHYEYAADALQIVRQKINEERK